MVGRRGVEQARHASQQGHVVAHHGVEIEVLLEALHREREDVLFVEARDAADLAHALLREIDRIDHDRQGDGDLQGHEDRARAVAQQRRKYGSDFHHCTLR